LPISDPCIHKEVGAKLSECLFTAHLFLGLLLLQQMLVEKRMVRY